MNAPHKSITAADDDEGMPSMEARLAQSRRNMEMIAALPPRPVPPVDTARADAAVRSLLPGLLTDAELRFVAKGGERFKRNGL